METSRTALLFITLEIAEAAPVVLLMYCRARAAFNEMIRDSFTSS